MLVYVNMFVRKIILIIVRYWLCVLNGVNLKVNLFVIK